MEPKNPSRYECETDFDHDKNNLHQKTRKVQILILNTSPYISSNGIPTD